MKLALILGTRPEIIKFSPIIRYLKLNKIDYFIIHTGQHYDYNMDKLFFEELALPFPNYYLGIKEKTEGAQTGRMITQIEEILLKEKPARLLVLGDTNSVAAGVLAAKKLHIKIGHIEAGLRSYDSLMSEESNRIVADHLSDLLFPPTAESKEILLKEGILEDKIHVVGNVIVDAVLENVEIAKQKSQILQKLNLTPNKYLLITMHSGENVDIKDRLVSTLQACEIFARENNLQAILPLHPRTKNRLSQFNLKIPDLIKAISPLGFFDFLHLESNAKLVFTDSGGVQEETCILKVPCVTLRDTTERPETIKVGSNIVAGVSIQGILLAAKEMMNKERKWTNPFGNGNSAERIINKLAI